MRQENWPPVTSFHTKEAFKGETQEKPKRTRIVADGHTDRQTDKWGILFRDLKLVHDNINLYEIFCVRPQLVYTASVGLVMQLWEAAALQT
jgi:hypothetical protein